MEKINRIKSLIKEFGFGVTFAKFFQSVTRKIPLIKNIAGKIKYKAITKFLYSENKDILEEYNNNEHITNSTIGNGNIWVLWWQGIDDAPDIVKICINSIKQNRGTREVVILNKDNYKNFIYIDSTYEDMLNTGKISITQFSDLLRLNLLFERGGLWMDATYLVIDELSKNINDSHFFTIRHGMSKEYPMSKGLWTSSLLGVAPKADEIRLFINIYDNYFKKHKVLVDYLLIDYIFATCCDHCNEIKRMFTNVPKNNENVNELLKIMNKPYSKEIIEKSIGETTLNKCNRRFDFKSRTTDQLTVYGYYCNKFL